MFEKLISLTGVKPTGTLHLGNFLGAIKPALELVPKYNARYFVADYHALTTVKDASQMSIQTLEVAAAWMACGLDTNAHLFYKQSDLPELCELAWILSCLTSKGLLNRSHAYKSLVEQNVSSNKDSDFNINMGLYSYPILMAADILAFDCAVVPVGMDQKQHVEIVRDIAISFNNLFGETFVVPEALIQADVQTIPGTDGRKMSKNYGNVIPLFGPPKQIKKAVMQITTDSTPLEEPKNPDTCNVYKIYSLFASNSQKNEMKQKYLGGNYGFGHAKIELFELLQFQFNDFQKKYDDLIRNPNLVKTALNDGAKKAQKLLSKKMTMVRAKVGF